MKIFLFFLCCFFANSFAQDANTEELKVVNNYLSQIKTYKASFLQSADEKQDSGTIYMKRPGKIKIDYSTSQTPLTINVSDGVFTYYDKSLDQKSELPAGQTIASIFLDDNFSLNSSQIQIVKTKKTKNGLVVTIQKKDFSNEGTFDLIFLLQPSVRLSGVVVHSPQNTVVKIKLFDEVLNDEILDSTFKVEKKVTKNIDIGD